MDWHVWNTFCHVTHTCMTSTGSHCSYGIWTHNKWSRGHKIGSLLYSTVSMYYAISNLITTRLTDSFWQQGDLQTSRATVLRYGTSRETRKDQRHSQEACIRTKCKYATRLFSSQVAKFSINQSCFETVLTDNLVVDWRGTLFSRWCCEKPKTYICQSSVIERTVLGGERLVERRANYLVII